MRVVFQFQVDESLAVTINFGGLDGFEDGSWSALAEYPRSEIIHISLNCYHLRNLLLAQLTTISADI